VAVEARRKRKRKRKRVEFAEERKRIRKEKGKAAFGLPFGLMVTPKTPVKRKR
jgi:hypothetical protein